jgi:hypothetical protein
MWKIFAFFAIQRYLSQFLNFGKIIVLSLNDCNTVNLHFFRLFCNAPKFTPLFVPSLGKFTLAQGQIDDDKFITENSKK